MKKYIFPMIIGAFWGIIAKVVDFIPGNTLIQYLGLKDIMNYYGIFILAVCIIEYRAKSIGQGIIYTLEFMFSMVISYYYVQYIAYNIWAYKYLILWCLVALCSPLLYLCITLRRKKGYITLIGILVPLLLLGNEVLRFIKMNDIASFQLWFDILSIIVLLFILPKNQKDRLISGVLLVCLIPFLSLFNFIQQIANLIYSVLFYGQI